ncbi:hypothetical protein AN641_03660 [Candidatus Epulonipiscioides gigas]|nr:hypothetical protein AN641_03660 [Epulopiscium sp. SCG-C07WGA-EpuloA2]
MSNLNTIVGNAADEFEKRTLRLAFKFFNNAGKTYTFYVYNPKIVAGFPITEGETGSAITEASIETLVADFIDNYGTSFDPEILSLDGVSYDLDHSQLLDVAY